MEHRYSVGSEMRDGVEVVVLQEGPHARALVAPSLGNNCFLFETKRPVLEPVVWSDFLKKPTSYGIPLLFPFPNRIRDGVFLFQGERFKVDPPRHGFVRDRPWNVVETGASNLEGAWVRCAIHAADHPQILNQFFPFTLEVTFRLRNRGLEIEAAAENCGERNMPTGFGIHPYFRRPERGTVKVPAGKRWELADSLPTGTLLDVEGAFDLRKPRDLAGLSLDDIYTDLAPDPSGRVQCFLTDEAEGTETVLDFDHRHFAHVVVYTPPAPRVAVCIEPNTCPTDAFNLQAQGIDASVIELKPGRKAEFHVRILSRDLK